MTLVGAPSAPLPAVATPRSLGAVVVVPVGTIVVIIAVALLPLLLPFVMHPMLTAAEAHRWLGTTPDLAGRLSDQTVAELLVGPGTFAFAGPDGRPMYGPDEVAHLRDVRTLLWLLLGGAALAAAGLIVRLVAGIDRAGTWRGIARGGALAAGGAMVIGIIGAVAFDPLFTLFHEVFFPGGDWAFDPRTQRLVQLYPYAYWGLAGAGLGALVVVLGAIAWLVGRRRGRMTP